MREPAADLVARLRRAGVARGDLVGLAVAPDGELGLATAAGGWPVRLGDGNPGDLAGGAFAAAFRLADEVIRPRWAEWSGETAAALAAMGVRLATCWDVAAVHRLLFGGWRADPGWAWAALRGLPSGSMPAARRARPADLFDLFDQAEAEGGDSGGTEAPVGPDGHLRPEWVSGGWSSGPGRLSRWAALAVTAAGLQQAALAGLAGQPMAAATALSESTAELLCAELSAEGLPVDRGAAELVLARLIGPRPHSEAEAARQRAARDAAVLRHAPPGATADLRSPAQVRSLLGRIGVDVPDTRAWRLRPLRDAHPLVGALLEWRKAERIATTYGYAWLDEHLGDDGRLRGRWTGSDGAAGRMTASGGLHNMPAALREAVAAEAGHVFVRADLGQIEPRVLAAVSGDAALAAATRADDLYAPVAEQLGVDRPTAKVAVLGAMYGQTTGYGAQALRRLTAAYPAAMAYLDEGDRAGRAGRDLRTYGGRLIPMAAVSGGQASGSMPGNAPSGGGPSGGGQASGGRAQPRETAARAAARGRYGRNALIQGAAAELFKMWAVTVRARAEPLGARIVLCLHDELLVHAPAAHGDAVARLVDDCLREAARRWAPGSPVRFLADTRIIRRWSDAKPGPAGTERLGFAWRPASVAAAGGRRLRCGWNRSASGTGCAGRGSCGM